MGILQITPNVFVNHILNCKEFTDIPTQYTFDAAGIPDELKSFNAPFHTKDGKEVQTDGRFIFWRYERKPKYKDEKPITDENGRPLYEMKTDPKTGELVLDISKIPRTRNGYKAYSTGYHEKTTKDPETGKKKKTSICTTWSWMNWKTAFQIFEYNRGKPGQYDGIGFVITDTPFVFLDFDHCLDENDKITDPAIQKAVDYFRGCYVEISPSGTGLHILVYAPKADIGQGNRPCLPGTDVAFEIYDKDRYMTITGNRYGDGFERMTDWSDKLNDFCKTLEYKSLSKASSKRGGMRRHDTYTNEEILKQAWEAGVKSAGKSLITDEEVIEKASRANGYGDEFKQLYEKGRAVSMAKYNTPSEYDMGLLNRLPFWTNGDVEQMRRIYRKSALYDGDDRMRKAEYGINSALNLWAGFDNYKNKIEGITPFARFDPNYTTKKMADGFDDDLIDVAALTEIPGAKVPPPNMTQFSGQPIALKCGAWHAADDSIYRLKMQKRRDIHEKQVAARSPLLPIARITNVEDDTEKVEVAYKTDRKWKSLVLPRTVLADSREIVKALAEKGINGVTSNTGKVTVDYFADLLTLNQDTLEKKKSVSHLGWIEKAKAETTPFAPYCGNIMVEWQPGNRINADTFTPKGSFEKWKSTIKTLRKNPVFRVIMAASFAAPLVGFLGDQSFIVHLWGRTGAGKTVSLEMAASVWGNPDSGLVGSLNSTNNFMLATACNIHSMPICLDELQTIKNKFGNYNKLIMQLTQNQNRGRLRKDGTQQVTGSWRTDFITTGEEPIVQEKGEGGMKNRVLEIECGKDLFEGMNKREIISTIRKNFGHAGRAFIEELQRRQKADDATEELKAKCDAYRAKLEKVKSGKQSALGALLCVADDVARKLFWPDEKETLYEALVPFLKAEKDVDQPTQAIEYVWDVIAANKGNFNCSYREDAIWGKWKTADDAGHPDDFTTVYINKGVLEDILEKKGIQFTAVKKAWAANGWLRKFGNDYTQRVSIDGVKTRVAELHMPTE